MGRLICWAWDVGMINAEHKSHNVDGESITSLQQ